MTGYSLTVTLVGKGSVSSDPSGLMVTDCSSGSHTFGSPSVTLTVMPTNPHAFVQWSDSPATSMPTRTVTLSSSTPKNLTVTLINPPLVRTQVYWPSQTELIADNKPYRCGCICNYSDQKNYASYDDKTRAEICCIRTGSIRR